MKKPISLFGVESKQQPCYFIHHEGFGYWFTSLKQRTVGEAASLSTVFSKVERMEIDNTLLILDICRDNKSKIVEEYLVNYGVNIAQTLPDKTIKKIKEEAELDNYSTETNIKLETFVRELLSSGDVQNPILYPYRERILNRVSNSIMFDYQTQVVIAAFKHRLILEEKYIVKNTNDNEKGYILQSDIEKYKIIGEPNPDLSEIGEQLTLQIYNFATTDFGGKDWQTSKDLGKSVTESTPLEIPSADDEDAEIIFPTAEEQELYYESDEKKLAASTTSEP